MDLSWRLKSTIPRIFFYLLPSIMFLCFLSHFRDEETPPINAAPKKKNS
jgi:hypothetical protein